jgi:hypothetical protein
MKTLISAESLEEKSSNIKGVVIAETERNLLYKTAKTK